MPINLLYPFTLFCNDMFFADAYNFVICIHFVFHRSTKIDTFIKRELELICGVR